MTDQTKFVIDLSSFAVVGGTLLEYLPAVAAVFSIIWTVIRIYETRTFQKLIKKWTR